MAFHVRTTRFMDFVQLVVSGPASMKSFVELVRDFELESLGWGDRKVMVDLRAMDGEFDAAEQMFLAELVAHHLPHLEKVASVLRSAPLADQGAGASPVKGMQLRVFGTHDEALAWLLADRAACTPTAAPSLSVSG
ncbi:MAG TPA: STAS/SEC14 domain-containing protein [Ramlibacter sp.]|nr:STAS/SEC14 domain-containing protein [Ramlibacter sp.]